MPMTAKYMFGVLTASTAAALLVACGQKDSPAPPAPQPVAAPVPAYPPAAPDEALTATTIGGSGTNAQVISDGPVNGVAACEARAREIAYLYKAANGTPLLGTSAMLTSCISPKDGLPRARFQCFGTATDSINCKPF